MQRTEARDLVNRLLDDLKTRLGFREVFDKVDDTTMGDLVEDHVNIILSHERGCIVPHPTRIRVDGVTGQAYHD